MQGPLTTSHTGIDRDGNTEWTQPSDLKQYKLELHRMLFNSKQKHVNGTFYLPYGLTYMPNR